CFLLVSGVPQVVCSSQPIVASLGDDVILPCHVEPPVEEEQLTVEWWRIDLPPDPRDPRSLDRYVHRYHDNQDEEDMKMPVYAGRTELLREELKHCNVSLKIINVKPSDGGLYRCFLPRLNSWRRSADIRLVVVIQESRMTTQKPRSQQTTPMNKETHIGVTVSSVGLLLSDRRGMIAAVVLFIFLILGGGGTLVQTQVSTTRRFKPTSPPGPVGHSECEL
ncbi:butyrophilin-like protein 2, partial [Stegastes partitus]|uniref:Butyrophilin-like protein 2 n=1 Tax=Stegastes partitus TaxID=144197 RepID=A0A9Y4NV09_9TELE